jgi:hypothetical protein
MPPEIVIGNGSLTEDTHHFIVMLNGKSKAEPLPAE